MTCRPRRRRALALGLLAPLLAGGRPARGGPPDPPVTPSPSPSPAPAAPEPHATITVNGSCPNGEAIWSAVSSIVPAKDRDRLGEATRIEVSDLGDTYRVAVTAPAGIDRLRVYRDAARDCDHRARFAAVFIVLTLMPPDVLLDVLPVPPPEPPPPPPPPPPERPRPPPPPPPPPPRPRRLRIELAFSTDLAPRADAPWAVALGGELRAAPGPRRTGPVGAVGVAGGTIDFGNLSATELRVPFDLGLRLPLLSRSSVDLVADLGLGGAIFRDTARNTAAPQSGTRLDLGARAALVVHHGRATGRLLELVGLHAEFFPRPYDVTLTPQGTVGRTPAFWFGATLGLAVQP
jgi:hypothetical protein